jgi:hypothetical protein
MKKENIPYLLLFIAAIFTVIMGVLIFAYPPAIFPDPSWGFQVMRSMQHGGGFNYLVGPSQTDIGQNTAQFLTWWSPGQYLVPYFFKLFFGVTTGEAAALTITVCQLLGLAGYYLLFRKTGFSRMLAAISILLIVSQEFYNIPFVFYNGGEILVFAFAGWFLYVCTAIHNKWQFLLLFVFLAGITGFFCKSSLMWVYAAGLCYLWIRLSYRQQFSQWVINGVRIGLPAMAALACIYLFFLSKGVNPASESGAGLTLTWEAFSFPLASPLLSGFSVDEMLHGLIFHQDHALFSPAWSLPILLILALLSMLLVFTIVKKVPERNYRMLVIVFYAVSFLFFSYVFLKQSAISFEGRHLRVMGLVIIPGTVYFLSTLKAMYRSVAYATGLIIVINSLIFLSHGYGYNKNYGVRGNTGISQEFIDQPSLSAVMALDRQYKNAIFVFNSPDLGLEIANNRIITLTTINDDLQLDQDEFLHEGHAGPLFIVLPANYAGAKAALVFKLFPGYSQFEAKPLSKAYMLYSAK